MMNKNIFKKLSAAALLLMASFSAANADNKLMMDNVFINPGETKTVSINLQNDDEISYLQCFISLPKGLSLIDNGEKDDAVCFFKSAATDRTTGISKVQISQNERQRTEGGQQYTLMVWDFPTKTKKISAGNGAIITFDVKADAEFSANVQELAITDIDGNGVVLNDTTAKVINAASDFNVTLTASEATVKAGEEATISVSMANKAEVWNYVVYAQLPTNLQFVSAEPSSRLDGTIVTKDMGDGRYRFFFAPNGLTNISGNEGEIMKLTVKTADDFAADTTVAITGFEALDMDELYYYAENISASVKIDNTSNINTFSTENGTDADGNSVVYDLSGRRVSSNAKGVLLKKVNGKMVKVVVK